MSLVRTLVEDTRCIAGTFCGQRPTARQLFTVLSHDGTVALFLSRLREAAGRHNVPLMGGLLRRLQTSLLGIEIGSGVRLGTGVVFVHTNGIVVGGDSLIGDRVQFMGNNTVGANGSGSCPRLGNDVVVGAGARILGPVTIGARAVIGANAVVVSDVPAGAVAAGVPATVRMHTAAADANEAAS